MADDAEAIARVVADVRKGLALNLPAAQGRHHQEQAKIIYDMAQAFSTTGPVIDVTPIYQDIHDSPPTAINLYDDHECIAPPWIYGTFAFRNQHGNVMVMSSIAVDWFDREVEQGAADLDVSKQTWKDAAQMMERLVGGHDRTGRRDLWNTYAEVDWTNVRWTIDTFLWLGGRNRLGPMPTSGPHVMWRFAILADGSPADLHWVQMGNQPMDEWDMSQLVLLHSLNFCNATNTVVQEPERTRPERKRISRTGVRVEMIHVKPFGKSSRGETRIEPLDLTARHGVRGHMAHYGDCCPGRHEPKGMLFGKMEGRYWIPPHVRGNAEHGVIEQSYTLEPE